MELFFLAVYFSPIIVSLIRKSNNLVWIVLINIFLGWSIIGWFTALIIALVSDSKENYNFSSKPTWAIDPYGRYEYRFWDGIKWTDQVSSQNVLYCDPPTYTER